MPFFGDLARILGGQGGMGLDAARQLAQQIASAASPSRTPTRPSASASRR
jgi:hypothetical protein